MCDHKPVVGSVFITNNNPQARNSLKLPKKFHKFDWKNNDFISLFKPEVNNINLEFYSLDPNDDLAKLVDKINYLTKWLIKCAPKAESEFLKKIEIQTKKFIKEERKKIRTDYQMKSRNNCQKIDQLLDKNRDEFWRAFKEFKKKHDVKTNKSFVINDGIKRRTDRNKERCSKKSVQNKFCVTDIKEAMNKLKLGKSVGVGYISNEMLFV
ncbi:unnamed protein product [Brachionus calyciflorus]|uniref:Uncharacterized protein n=1 Tax=Brachionus calyciflorus TaxID=104777 RepID=A0A814MV93_9BILA|nr:unnamed protein product [Brachionus calyciflorus]